MKASKLFGFIAASVIALAGCGEKEETPAAPSLSVDPATVSFETAGGSSSVTIVATRDWTATSTADWVSIEPASGKGSNDDQQVTVTVLSNSGTDRTAEVKFSIGFDDKVLAVAQAGEAGSAEASIVYKNDFDKEVAAKTYGSGSSWPYLDQFDGWKNASGTGIGSETYAFNGISARANSTSNGNYADYAGSGNNNLFFGSSAYFSVAGLKLGEARNYTLSFGAEKYSQDGNSVFSHSEFHVYVGDGSGKWVELEYAFAKGTDPEGRWDLASTNFTLPAATTALSIYVKADAASVYRLDDLSLTISSEAGTAIDFSKGVDLGGSDSGENPGTDDKNAVYKNNFDKAAAGNTYGSGSSWPYLDQFDGWQNASGTGVGSETYAYSGVSARSNSTSNGSYADYAGSGSNNLFFGTNAYFSVSGIKLSDARNYTLSFGAEKYSRDGNSVFSHSEFHVYVGDGSGKWVELEYAFAKGTDPEGRWDLASTNFTLPASTTALSIYVKADAASVYRLDDLSLTISSEAGTAIDFSKGVDLGGSDSGENPGGEENPDTGEYASNVSWTLGENSYSDKATVNKVENVSVLKLGKSTAAGSATITLPKGTTKLSYYGVSWKNKATTLSVKVGDAEIHTQELATNDGATATSPYKITVSSSDYYTFNLPAALTEDTTITVTTSGSNYRLILFGIKAE